MANETDSLVEDPLVLVHTRNFFYRQKYHVLFAVNLLGLCVLAALLGCLIYLLKNPTQPVYFVTDGAGRLIQDIPLSQPNMSDAAVGDWASKAVAAAYTYDYIDYRGELQRAAKYFTDYGWRNYMKGLQQSDNLLGLAQHKWIVVAEVVGQPKLVGAAVWGNARIYTWKYEMPLLVSYYSAPYDEKSRVTNPLKVSVLVQRQSILNSENGLGIVQMIAEISG